MENIQTDFNYTNDEAVYYKQLIEDLIKGYSDAQGQIKGNYTEHIKMNASPTETYFTDGTVVTEIHHKFEDVKEGSTISFTITSVW